MVPSPAAWRPSRPSPKPPTLTTSVADPLTIQNGFAAAPSQTVTNTFAINPNYKLSYAQTWNFAIQNTLPHALVVEMEYIGTKGTNLAVNEAAQPHRGRIVRWLRHLCRSPTPRRSATSPPAPIPSSTPDRYASPAASPEASPPPSSTPSRNRLTTPPVSPAPAAPWSSTSTTSHSSAAFPPSTSATTCRRTFLFSSPVGVHGMMRNGGWKTAALAGWTLSGTVSAVTGTPLTATMSAATLSNTGGNGGARQHPRPGHRTSHRSPHQRLFQPRPPSPPPPPASSATPDATPFPACSRRRRQCFAESRLPLRRNAPPAAVPPQRHQRFEPRGDHRTSEPR